MSSVDCYFTFIPANVELLRSDSTNFKSFKQTRRNIFNKKTIPKFKKNIEFMWVPSHIGIARNEKAYK